MHKIITLTAFALLTCFVALAQEKDKDKQTKGEKIMETIKNLPDDLLAQPDAVPDSNANKIMNDNLSIEVHPIWKEKGTTSIIEYKMLKCDVDPVRETFPLPDKKLVQGLTVNLNTIKKSPEEKRQAVLAQIQSHLTAYYKEQGTLLSKEEMAEKMKAMQISDEPFSTAGRNGHLYYMHDIQSLQSGLMVLLLLPGTDGKSVTFVHFHYFHYAYETTLPEDPLELRMFTYPEDQQAYIDFTKEILKTLVIK